MIRFDFFPQVFLLVFLHVFLLVFSPVFRIVKVGVQSRVFNSLYFCIRSLYNLYGAFIKLRFTLTVSRTSPSFGEPIP